ncbi:rRNA maturation RNase YbeY [bacterium]|uniref:Endoribonuclease YbeY n=2 Tax=Katanobacteria TaxID=422282 RepID=A0A2M7X2V4_UNCKA|nr:rRNA maturation RNase YbeY [bacterium]PIP56947.1 MAG: rRNA maturation RNase YbeY [candidate division WWE3 bacterium CG22_combo_CG10-13_8_21_14_all_39_12]PJA40512.1 MAG: rRNA maturation RNase YbeY [candidate division WWE3 bacterium CG_4_9_14_3_um_filter_39_7]
MKNNRHNVSRVSFVLTHDQNMIELNTKVFGKEDTTDVISFPMQDKHTNSELIGEIVINVDEVKRNALDYGVTYEQELARVTAHGVLHLVGYEDDTTEHRSAMSRIEDTVVSEIKSN